MQQNHKTGKPELDCISCVYNGKVCNCIIYAGDTKLKNLYERK